MSTTQEAEVFFAERGFGQPFELGEKPALIVVDVIVGFTDSSLPMGSDLSFQIEQMNRLLDFVHAHRIPVYFTTIAYDASMSDAGIWAHKMQGLETLVRGTRTVELDARLHVKDEDALLTKKFASAFFGTDLVSRLINDHVDTVLVTGCTTSGCVRATVVDALQYGFKPIVVEDCVGDRWPDSHRVGLFDMRQKYADIVDCNTVLTQLAQRYEHAAKA
ncbi:isochorismatase [Alicyclobacillus acidoterrestris]|uniref:isochorismatase family protein n=1 Tax=Alicyclobacillus suci TaxID=2816080 RepID=UPI0011910D04|nr:isochorismatase family protein [Alicyclobacillus suci]GEO26453.1 isochorismatase [Alicyclobacillus acidoterrestris]